MPTIPSELHFEFLRHAALPVLFAWAASAKGSHDEVAWELYMRHRRMLAPYFADVDAFLGVMEDNDAIISGSFALNYIQGSTSWAHHDIDFYLPYTTFAAFCQYLQVKEQYSLVAHYRSADHPAAEDVETLSYPTKGILYIARYRKAALLIDVMCTGASTASYALPSFWTTLLMNYLTCNGFCCAYPDYTFGGTHLLSLDIARNNF